MQVTRPSFDYVPATIVPKQAAASCFLLSVKRSSLADKMFAAGVFLGMRILIMGAGLAGVTAAFELMEDGHDITVIDRQPGPARETSFANAGLVAPGHAFAWGSPKAPKTLLKSLFKEGQPLRYRLRFDPAMWRWSLKFLRECTAERARINTERKHRLCRYAQLALQDVVERSGVAYDGERKGCSIFIETPRLWSVVWRTCRS